MRLYIVTEDEGALYLLPKWIEHLRPDLERMEHLDASPDLGYYLVSGRGFPRVFSIIRNAVLDILDRPGHFDELVVVVDSGEATLEETSARVVEACEGAPCRVRSVVAWRSAGRWETANS